MSEQVDGGGGLWRMLRRACRLSMGTLGDEGANALIASPSFGKLERVDLSHHYMSPSVAKKIAAGGPTVVAKDRQEQDADGARYILVAA